MTWDKKYAECDAAPTLVKQQVTLRKETENEPRAEGHSQENQAQDRKNSQPAALPLRRRAERRPTI